MRNSSCCVQCILLTDTGPCLCSHLSAYTVIGLHNLSMSSRCAQVQIVTSQDVSATEKVILSSVFRGSEHSPVYVFGMFAPTLHTNKCPERITVMFIVIYAGIICVFTSKSKSLHLCFSCHVYITHKNKQTTKTVQCLLAIIVQPYTLASGTVRAVFHYSAKLE